MPHGGAFNTETSRKAGHQWRSSNKSRVDNRVAEWLHRGPAGGQSLLRRRNLASCLGADEQETPVLDGWGFRFSGLRAETHRRRLLPTSDAPLRDCLTPRRGCQRAGGTSPVARRSRALSATKESQPRPSAKWPVRTTNDSTRSTSIKRADPTNGTNTRTIATVVVGVQRAGRGAGVSGIAPIVSVTRCFSRIAPPVA